MPGVTREPSTDKTLYLLANALDGGWSTRSYPHRLKDNQVQVLDNFMHLKDNVWTIRPGNINYGGGNGKTGSGAKSMSGFRFYKGNPTTGTLLVHTGNKLYSGNDGTGAFTQLNGAMSTTQFASFAQMYDEDNTNGAATSLFVCDGSRIPQEWDGTNFSPVQTGFPFLPSGNVSGSPIAPLYCCNWDNHLVYANEPTDPTAVWISDTGLPQRFTATALVNSNSKSYSAYYPAGPNPQLGVITGIIAFGPYLIVFYTNGIVVGQNTGSYGAFQYVWNTIARTLGCPSPQSIVAMDTAVIFFGGDRFYATDGQYIRPLPDEPQSVYNTDNTAVPAEMQNLTNVSAARRSLTYLAAYQSTANVSQDRVLVFDTQANGGWDWLSSAGGAWSRFPSGMGMAWGLECRGPGDGSRPFFWGSSTIDQIAQFDPPAGVYSDFGNAISWEIRTKSYELDNPMKPKTIEGIYPLMVFNQQAASYNLTVSPYALINSSTEINFSSVTFAVTPQGVTYGGNLYGTFKYQSATTIVELQAKSYPQGGAVFPQGRTITMGASGTTTNPFNIIGFMGEIILEEVEI